MLLQTESSHLQGLMKNDSALIAVSYSQHAANLSLVSTPFWQKPEWTCMHSKICRQPETAVREYGTVGAPHTYTDSAGLPVWFYWSCSHFTTFEDGTEGITCFLCYFVALFIEKV